MNDFLNVTMYYDKVLLYFSFIFMHINNLNVKGSVIQSVQRRLLKLDD